jgi:hypothetical protein
MPGEAPPAPQSRQQKNDSPHLSRGIGDRLAATASMIWLRPEIPLFAAGILVAARLAHAYGFILGEWCLILAPLFAKASIPILYLGHATRFTDALFLANNRGIPLALHSIIYFFGMMFMTIAVTTGIYNLHDPTRMLAGLGMVALLAYPVSSIWLLPIVAAVGSEEEPGYRIPRSHQLVSVGRTQAILSIVGFTAIQMAAIKGVQTHIGEDQALYYNFFSYILPVIAIVASVVMDVYWFLFYVEAKQALEVAQCGIAPEGPSKADLSQDE